MMEKSSRRSICRVSPALALALATALSLAIVFPQPARAFSESPVGSGSPTEAPPLPPGGLSVVPGEKAAQPAPTATPRPKVRKKKTTAHGKKVSAEKFEVEPMSGRLKIKQDAYIFTRPSKWSPHIIRAHAGKYVVLTGSTRYYLQVRLKDGKTGYIAQSAVELVRPTDKYFKLTHNAPVLDKPNRWGKKLAEVHRPYYVHVIGVAPSYMQIRMKSGLVGFIPVTALE
jgi:hypothetical protein